MKIVVSAELSKINDMLNIYIGNYHNSLFRFILFYFAL